MPAKSQAFQRLAGAAEHGAEFPAAKQLRASMTDQQLHEFASGPMKGKPEHAPHPHKNLGGHLHPPKSGDYVTNHHRSAKKRG